MDQYYQNAMSGLTHAGDLLGEGDQTSRFTALQTQLQKLLDAWQQEHPSGTTTAGKPVPK
jgi:hypothetical protein